MKNDNQSSLKEDVLLENILSRPNETLNYEIKKYTLKIKDMAPEDKPREKLINQGPLNLSLVELVAIILNTGSRKEDVISMSSRIIKDYGEKNFGIHKNVKKLAEEFNIPITKASQIIACSEIGRRFFDRREYGQQIIRTAKDVYDYLPKMRHLSKEHLQGIYLNTHYRVIHDEVISIGTIDASLIHPREIFRPAIEHGAAGIVLVHNHPSGISRPSEEDIVITNQIISVGKIIGIPIIDHVIIGKDNFTSIKTEY